MKHTTSTETDHPDGGNGRGHAWGHAVVIGGSMAGLLAARVLSEHFRRVTVVDRDRFPQEPAFRKGVPQSRFPHVLLPSGLRVLRRLFPGIVEGLVSAGAVRYLWPRDALWLTPGGWSGRFAHDAGRVALSQSRELVEWAVRRRVAALENVRVLEGREAIGLLASADRREVTGVRLRPRPSAGAGKGEELNADLVVDASGRNSPAPRWLGELSYEPPEETNIDAFLGYAGRTYAVPSGPRAGWKIIFIQANPPADGRGGILLPIEGDRWSVALFGGGRDYPPTDEDGFLAFARGLRSPVLYEAIRRAEPLTPIHGYRRTANRRRHYERLRRLPERFVVTGDAACAFNPVYGQGMSVAAAEAGALDRCLHEGRRRSRPGGELTGLPRRFQKEVARSHAGAWTIASGEDLRYPTAEGARRDLPTRLTHRYFDRVVRTAMGDAVVNLAFVDVIGLLAPPASLLRPSVLLRALRNGGIGASASERRAARRASRAPSMRDKRGRGRRTMRYGEANPFHRFREPRLRAPGRQAHHRRKERHRAHDAAARAPGRGGPSRDRLQLRGVTPPGLIPQPARQPRGHALRRRPDAARGRPRGGGRGARAPVEAGTRG